MRTLIASLILFLSVGVADAAGILFYYNFEGPGAFYPNAPGTATQGAGYLTPSHVNVTCAAGYPVSAPTYYQANTFSNSTEQYYAGAKSGKIVMGRFLNDACDWMTNESFNLQLHPSSANKNNWEYGVVYRMGFAIFIPNTVSQPDEQNIADGIHEWMLLWQHHQAWEQFYPPGSTTVCDDGAGMKNPLLAHYVLPDTITTPWEVSISIAGEPDQCEHVRNERREGFWYNGALSRGVWHTVDYEVKFHYLIAQGPYLKIWVDATSSGDTPVINDTGINCFNDAKGPYFMFGPYGHMNQDVTIYIDEWRVGDASSTWAEIHPQGGTPTPDTDPPLISAGAPSGTLPVGTTSTSMTCTTSENATVKFSTTPGTAYGSMTGTFDTTGAQSHSEALTGLANGTCYTYYLKAQDGSANTSADYPISFCVDSPTGTNDNLLANATVIASSDNFSAGYEYSRLVDDDVNTCAASVDDAQIYVEYDLGQTKLIDVAEILGDVTGYVQSDNWTVKYKVNYGDAWTTAFSAQDCSDNAWFQETMGVVGRYVRVEVNGPYPNTGACPGGSGDCAGGETCCANGYCSATGTCDYVDRVEACEVRMFGSNTTVPTGKARLIPRAARPGGAMVPRATQP